MKDRKIEIDIAKGIGIILVVLGHAFPDASASGGISNFTAHSIYSVVYSFHMPLFIFLSGLVSGKVLLLNGKGEKTYYIQKRIKRLIIPYIALSLCYMPIKIVMGKLANNPYNVKDIWKILLGESPNYALWTLWALFMLSVITVIFGNKKTIKVILGVSFLIWIFGNLFLIGAPVGVSMMTRTGIYYFAGVYISGHYEKIKKVFSESYLTIPVCLAVFIIANYFMIVADSVSLLELFTAISGVVLSMIISKKIGTYTIGKSLSFVGKYSMDIYVISTFVQPVVRVIFWSKVSVNYAIFTCLSVICGVGISILVSKYIVRKNKILRGLVLGMD